MVSVAAARRFGTFSLDVLFQSNDRRVVLFGPSGAGKTLTLHCVAGFVLPERGHIHVDDAVLLDTRRGVNVPPWRRRLGVVLQGEPLFPHLTAGANVMYGMPSVWRGREPTRALALLAAVGLSGYADRRPASLSAGERQRVALARALASDPRALLLDEPFSAVDAPVREQLRRDLLTLVESRGLPLLAVTHDFDEAHMLGETVVVLANGRVIQTGPPAEIARRPRTATVARLVGAANVFRAAVAGRDGAYVTVEAGPFVLRVQHAGREKTLEVSVRPEDVRLLPLGSAGVTARVHRVFARRTGTTALLMAGGAEIEVFTAGPPPSPGSEVDVSVSDGAVHVLEPEETRAAEPVGART